MDIREFYKPKQQKNDQTDNFNQNTNEFFNSANQTSQSPHQNTDFSEYQQTIDKYKDLSQQELYGELLKHANDLKSQGKLDSNTLNTISNTLSPMLNDEQKQLLETLINRIK